MFEVQLGAAILIQARSPSGVVRILADGGVTGHPAHWVHDKLDEAFRYFDGAAARRIDLIIGTHYDADHLDGLVPVIADATIDIGETWLPPVANDTIPHAAEEEPGDEHLLALQFAGPDGDEIFAHYLAQKDQLCAELADLEHSADEFDGSIAGRRRSFAAVAEGPPDPFDVRTFFEWHLADAAATLGSNDFGHASDVIAAPQEPSLIGRYRYYREDGISPDELRARWTASSSRAATDARTLAAIRRSTAKDAINAVALKAVVDALRVRNLPMRSCTIADGTPRRFAWKAAQGRFVPSIHEASDGPVLTLLGPSDGLVKKHWDRLPIGTYYASVALARLPIKSITPSNQLSYVVRVSFEDQNILITGDAGFVDFSSGRDSFYPDLLSALAPLQVVQVAHHGGNNAYFYRALMASPFADQQVLTFLLLSHATDDKFRPSSVFAKFIEQLRRPSHPVSILFTTRPQEKFVRDFGDLIEPVSGGPAGDAGDVRLSFDGGNWVVDRHWVDP